ncbi:MAG: hypothetical protein KDA24_04470 [Deltaproteobacteria bacterium]|nr:hypothetical protein [Deltaproteobacteria bacterium]
MIDHLSKAEALFRKLEPKPAPKQQAPEKRRRVVRNLDALKTTQPDGETTESHAEALVQAASALKEKFAATRKLLGVELLSPPQGAPEPARSPVRSPALPPQPLRRRRPSYTPPPQPEAKMAPRRTPQALPTPEPATIVEPVPEHRWRLHVVSPGDEERAFFLAASDMLEAALVGAREIARWMGEHRPGVGWRVQSVEHLTDVL